MFWNAKNGVVLVDGTEMDYVSFGLGKKNLIFLPGLSDGLATVKGKALLLALSYSLFVKDFKVYIFSRKNHLPENYSISEMADDQAKAMHSLGIYKASVLGVSEGGMIAQYLAINHSEMIDKLVLAVTTSKISDSTRATLLSWVEYAEQKNYRQLMIDTAKKSYSEKYIKRYKVLLLLICGIGKPKTYLRFLTNARAILNFESFDEIESIRCPTLIIGGTLDKIVGPNASYEIHKKIPKSQIYMYDGLGHAVYEEAKKDFDRRVLDFLNLKAEDMAL